MAKHRIVAPVTGEAAELHLTYIAGAPMWSLVTATAGRVELLERRRMIALIRAFFQGLERQAKV